MDFPAIIQKIEERGDFNRYAEVKPSIEAELKRLKKGDHTTRGLCYYYLLVSYLKAQLVHETEESIEFYEKMDEAFMKQEEEFCRITVTLEEMRDFYRLMDRCYNSLSFLYQRHDFKTRHELAYNRKMSFRKNHFWIEGNYLKWVEYKFLELTCQYGNSVGRWTLTTFSFMFVMSIAYMSVDTLLPQAQRLIPEGAHWFDYFYFSVIILTTVGLGDIVPLSVAGKVLVSTEAFFGFIMLGVFLGMMNKKL